MFGELNIRYSRYREPFKETVRRFKASPWPEYLINRVLYLKMRVKRDSLSEKNSNGTPPQQLTLLYPQPATQVRHH